MKNDLRLIGVLSTALLSASMWLCQPGSAADEQKRWGFVNVKGELLIKPQYLNAGNFSSDGLAPVQVYVKRSDDSGQDERWGFVNKQGELAIQATFDEVLGFREGVAPARLPDGKWGFIDKTGKFVIEPQFDRADCFSEGVAAVSDGKNWGFIDKQAKWVIEPRYQRACRFSGGRAAVLINDGTGMLSLDIDDDIYSAYGGHFNYIDKTGKTVIDANFDGSGVFSDGLAPVAVGTNQGVALPDKWGFLNKDGMLKIKPRFASVHAPSEGMVAVKTGQWKNIGQGFRTWMPGKWGYINTKGKQIIASKFDGADAFSEGMAGILIDKKWGYIDKTGKIVIEPKFVANGSFHEELAPVCVQVEAPQTSESAPEEDQEQ